jgi:hypothetical protein
MTLAKYVNIFERQQNILKGEHMRLVCSSTYVASRVKKFLNRNIGGYSFLTDTSTVIWDNPCEISSKELAIRLKTVDPMLSEAEILPINHEKAVTYSQQLAAPSRDHSSGGGGLQMRPNPILHPKGMREMRIGVFSIRVRDINDFTN